MLNTLFIDLWSQIEDVKKRQLFLILFLMIVASFSEVLSLGAIIPFLSALSNPVNTIYLINKLIGCPNCFSDIQHDTLLVFLTLIFVVVVLS